MIGTLKKHWRVVLLVVIIIASSMVLFLPQFAPDAGAAGANETADAQQGVTNIQYGLDLAGGTRIQAPLMGYTATDVQFDGDNEATVAANVANELPDTDSTDVGAETTDPEDGGVGNVEVTDHAVDEDAFREAIEAAGYEYDTTRPGVLAETREAAIGVISEKINQAGLSGGSVRQVTDAGGRHFMLIEVPGEDRDDVTELLQERGTVRIDIYYPNQSADDGYTTVRNVLRQEDFDDIGTATRGDGDRAYVPVTVVNQAPEGEETPAERFERLTQGTDVAQPGGSRCTYMQGEEGETSEPCLLLVVDDEVVNAFGMNPNLAETIRDGDFATDPRFQLTTGSGGDAFERAQEVSVNLRAGALPARLDIAGEGTSSFISPTQGENFRIYSMLTGIIAIFAVAGMVFLRYREKEVALPMILTALAEVYALLGFAALVGYPIDLAVMAGFIAVVGTGVDDLIIIADEVMSEGEVNSRKVFDSRFRRAFWVIGAAAATTIIAMSPLMILSLGELSGFAIFTILGVLIGVLITRPAYGDILRHLLTVR